MSSLALIKTSNFTQNMADCVIMVLVIDQCQVINIKSICFGGGIRHAINRTGAILLRAALITMPVAPGKISQIRPPEKWKLNNTY